MGSIVKYNQPIDGKVKCQIIVDIKEALCLQGSLKGVSLFSPNLCTYAARITETGINRSTKYFEIPRELIVKSLRRRKKTSPSSGPVTCQRIENDTQHIFIYTMQKNQENSSF